MYVGKYISPIDLSWEPQSMMFFLNETREETLTISSHCHWLVDSDDDGLILDGNPVQMTGFSFHLGGVFLINGPHNPPIHGENHHQFTLSMYD